ncbi:MAG: hypothetical protein LBC72_05350, partial [Spirochaetaceae bacterium]|nr:hypothetical protein [Spirochaetaceae bacterium]
MSTRKDLFRTSGQEYRKAGKKERGEILDRLTEPPHVSDESKEELKRRKGLYNPLRLNEGLNRAV